MWSCRVEFTAALKVPYPDADCTKARQSHPRLEPPSPSCSLVFGPGGSFGIPSLISPEIASPKSEPHPSSSRPLRTNQNQNRCQCVSKQQEAMHTAAARPLGCLWRHLLGLELDQEDVLSVSAYRACSEPSIALRGSRSQMLRKGLKERESECLAPAGYSSLTSGRL